MPKTCPPGQHSESWLILALDRVWQLTPKDIESEWMDIMVKRLFRELHRQLAVLEDKKVDTPNGRPTAGEQAQNARTLASLEATLERLSRLEKERDARRTRKNAMKDADARKALERKLDKQLAAQRAQRVSRKPDRG